MALQIAAWRKNLLYFCRPHVEGDSFGAPYSLLPFVPSVCSVIQHSLAHGTGHNAICTMTRAIKNMETRSRAQQAPVASVKRVLQQ
jgi:hypothetical protein